MFAFLFIYFIDENPSGRFNNFENIYAGILLLLIFLSLVLANKFKVWGRILSIVFSITMILLTYLIKNVFVPQILFFTTPGILYLSIWLYERNKQK